MQAIMFRKKHKKYNSEKTSDGNQQLAAAPPSLRKIPPTIISSDVSMLGSIKSNGMVDIDGKIEGNVCAQVMYVRENAKIKGDITADSELHIFGVVQGIIKSPKVCLYAKAHVEGVILHETLSIEDGAYVDAQFKPCEGQLQLAFDDSDPIATEEDFNILKDYKLVQ
jgi:cytoskeletal protein CcmA (bactofilin family)